MSNKYISAEAKLPSRPVKPMPVELNTGIDRVIRLD